MFEQDEIKNYQIKNIPGSPEQASGLTNKPRQNVPENNSPLMNTEYAIHQNREYELSEEPIPSEHITMLRNLSSSAPIAGANSNKNKNPKNEEQEVFQMRKFRQSDIQTTGTETARYTIQNNSTEYIKVDYLKEYQTPGSDLKSRTFESMYIKFECLDHDLKCLLRKKLEKVKRSVSEKGSDFIALMENDLFRQFNPMMNEIKPGQWNIGYGHKVKADEYNYFANKELNRAQALELFTKDKSLLADKLNGLLKVFLTQHEFDALVSFAFREEENERRLMEVIHLINNYQLEEAGKWMATDELNKTRSTAEGELFLHNRYVTYNYQNKE